MNCSVQYCSPLARGKSVHDWTKNQVAFSCRRNSCVSPSGKHLTITKDYSVKIMANNFKVYPKQYKFDKIKAIKNKCFFIMPFSEEFDIVYGSLRKSLTESGYLCSRVDEIPKSTPIISKILSEILNSQYIIADLTNSNPNVFYELGIAHSFKDAQNILLIKRKGTKIPFDIMHLTYFEYEEDNLKYISSVIKQNLKDIEYLYDFNQIIEEKGITKSLTTDREELVEDLKNLLSDDILVVTNLLNYQAKLSDEDLNDLLLRLESKIKKYTQNATDEKIISIFNFLFEILLSSQNRQCITSHINYLLGDFFIDTDLSDLQILSIKTDLVLKFAAANVQIPLIMPWIVQYFSRSKAANIDLNRYKLESFLLTTENDEINRIITNSVRNSDCHIREHFADIIASKKLITANDSLILQLSIEKNYFSAMSIIQALGKLQYPDNIKIIDSWFRENENEIMKTKQYFVLKHIYLAYKNIDSNVAKEFYAKYKKYLKEFFI